MDCLRKRLNVHKEDLAFKDKWLKRSLHSTLALVIMFMHFRLIELKTGFSAKPIFLLADGTVSFDGGAPHGKYIVQETSHTIDFNCKADLSRVRRHTYH